MAPASRPFSERTTTRKRRLPRSTSSIVPCHVPSIAAAARPPSAETTSAICRSAPAMLTGVGSTIEDGTFVPSGTRRLASL